MKGKIIVNGQERDWVPGMTVGGLLEALSLRPERTAVEINGRILHGDWVAEHEILEGDRLELVHFVGGG